MTEPTPIHLDPADIRVVDINAVQPWPGNPRRGDVEGLRLSLRRWGLTKPILVQKDSGYIIAGNHIWRAAVAEGYQTIAVVYRDMTDVEARAYLLADNKWSERGSSDPDAVREWLEALYAEGAVDDALGYTSEEVDTFLQGIGTNPSEADEAPPPPREVWVKPGQLFRLGNHRLLVGDATQPDSYDRLFEDAGQQAGLIWTDPPYGVDYEGGTPEHLSMANDSPDKIAMRALLDASMGHSVGRLKPGSGVYVCGPGGSMSAVFVDALERLGVYRQTIVWVKDSLVLGRQDYHYRHELVLNGAKPKEPKGAFAKEGSPVHYGWRPGAGHYFVTDRSLDTVWEISRPRANREHPTMKPVELVERSIRASSRRGDIVLDPFLGSGTTIIAAHRTDRRGFGIEIDPMYAQVVLQRFEAFAGITPEELT